MEGKRICRPAAAASLALTDVVRLVRTQTCLSQDVSHFAQVFRRTVGMALTQFRNAL
jgi:hypothetical protein